ncbi:uncharacterized protein LOC122047223 isoform X1 [Zingiber officinale]|uniref:uncharacterized protein LOC122047223 isoform X1 n=1 Tax=Zingiber officinale TaxID=94328 RepID=UPI001C4B5923|nr:uncharacterized protein LOC122047223 isoform X1 [Zingiber officinale]XP_042464299.1 uncharacterized protein LOC122047223 isoform X1 [Zingiber officinale]
MDDSWLSKCVDSSPQMSPLLATELGSQAVRSPHLTQAPAPASAAQVHKNTKHHFHSFIRQEAVLNDHARVQETAAVSNLNLGYRLGKTELGNSFLALLSDEFSHLPHSRMDIAKIHINNDKVLTGTGCVVPSINIPPLPENHGNGSLGNWNEHSSFVVSRTATNPASTKVPFLHNNVRLVGDSHHARDYVEVVPCQSSQSNNTGTAITPWDELCNSGRSANADKNSNKDVHASRIISFDAKSPISHNNSSYLRGRPLVFCRSTVGELFMGDAGLLGVLCFCHNSHMSVPKFCEHSGSPSVNPGEAVYLENGMNISHWCKQYLGIMAPDEIIGGEWSGGSATVDVSVGSKASYAPILLNNNVAISNIKSFGGSWRPAKPLSNSIPSSPYIKVRYTMQDKSINKEHDNVRLSYNFHGTKNCQKMIPSSVPASMPNAMKKQLLNTQKHPPISVGLEKVHSTLFKGKEIVVQQLNTSDGTYTGKHTSCMPLACSWTNGTVRHDDDIDDPNSSAEAPLADIDGASNIELRLGQPSEKYSAFAGSLGSSVLQIGPAYDTVKPQPYQQLKERSVSHAAAKTWTANQIRKNLHFSSSEASPYNKGSTQHAARSFNARNHFDSEGLTRDANMNPLISLFLSHLEGNNTSLSLDNLFNGSEHLSSKTPHNVCNSVGDSTHGTRSVCNTSTVNFPNKLDEGKNILTVESDTTKSDSMVQKQNEVTITREISAPFNSKCCQNSILGNGKDFSFYLDNQSNMVQKQSVGNTKQQEKTAFLSNKECDDPIPCGSSGTDLLKSDHLMSSTTLCSLETSKNIFATTKHSMDAKSKNSAFRRVVEFSTQESSNAAKANSQHHQLCCLSSSKPESCKDEFAVQTDLREGSYCKTHLNDSKVVRHSCPSCRSAVGMDIFSGHSCHTGSTRTCNCSCSTKRALLKSEKCCKRFSSCCNCDVDEQPCLRLGRLSNNCFPGDHKHEMFNHREHTSCSYGHCCTSVFPYCFHGFYTSGSNSTSKALSEQEVCGQANITHTTGDNNSNYLLPECKRIRLTHCDCSKNNSGLRNDQQTVFWRDVPKKNFAHAGASHDKFAEALKSTKSVGDQVPNYATEFNKAHLNSHVTKAPQMSNMSSGSSAPVLTQVSMEVNNSTPCIRTSTMMHDLVVDEGSGNEKCGSSDVVIRDGNEGFNTVDKVNVAKSRFDCLASDSSINPIDELHSKIPYKSKKVKCLNEGLAKKENGKYRCKLEMTPKTAVSKSEDHNPSFDPFGGPEILNNVRHLENDSSRSQEIEVSKPGCVMQRTNASHGSAAIIKRKRSVLSFNKFKERIGYQDGVPKDDDKQLQNDDISLRRLKRVGEKMKQGLVACSKHESRSGTAKPPKFMSLNCIANISSKISLPKKSKPVVCGNSGIISSGGTDGDQKPAKIISLASILKRARKCNLTETSDTAVSHHSETSEDAKNSAIFRRLEESCECLRKNGEDLNSPSTAKAFHSGNNTGIRCHLHSMQSISNLRCKDICTCSPGKLAAKFRHHAKSTCSSTTEINECSKLTMAKDQLNCSPSAICGLEDQDNKLHQQKILEPASPTAIGSFPFPKNNQDHAGKLSQVSRSSRSLLNPDAFCCVCGSSNQGDTNQLLECHDCLIKVHQACYGVSKIPKGNWCCRPCKCNSQDIVCVLCGYGDGAMTRAVKCQNIIKSLLKAWKVGKGSYSVKTIPSEHAEIDALNPDSADEASKFNNCGSVSETCTAESKSRMSGKYPAFNSIIAGSLDPSVTQWVHMVCALWTPGTRCPNVDTMNTFDVSGALPAKKNVVCSLCKRSGGSCIECRVSSCSVPFHPWCAHQKGLLQSEIEGDDDEKVGFYGRCLHHAMPNNYRLDNHVVDPQQSLIKEECSCARTEVVRGRKRERTHQPNLQGPGKDGVCIVSQEQINAWLHINGQKCRASGLTKPSGSDVENDYRKEYILYKQLKRWKHLVVYKSGIHALGLYTSQFIPRGAMVVEYIGEIVGLRVADKREIEYQSGRRIQYKSACYFFRIDKEHIIDATRKGGIARFVNHACLPNCVAKVITVRNEKKVVFFAERDINPGEEITYDYHFNSEDEGEKIPCFCDSKNCRRYLN